MLHTSTGQDTVSSGTPLGKVQGLIVCKPQPLSNMCLDVQMTRLS